MIPGSVTQTFGRIPAWLILLTTALPGEPSATGVLPARLSESGLYADIASKTIAPSNLMYPPISFVIGPRYETTPDLCSSGDIHRRYRRRQLDISGRDEILEGVLIREAGGNESDPENCAGGVDLHRLCLEQ